MRLFRIIIPVPDLNEAMGFYSKLFGKKGMQVSEGRCYFHLEGIIIAIYDPKLDGDDLDDWKFHYNQFIYFSAKNLKEVQTRIKDFDDIKCGEIQKMPWGERLFYTKDPFGTPICFVEESSVFKGWK